MSTKQERILHPDCHRAVNWNEKAVAKVIERAGFVLVGAKVDGFRCHIYRDQATDEIHIVTREGIEMRSLSEVRDRLRNSVVYPWLATGLVLDCEVHMPGVPFQEASGHFRRYQPVQDPVQFVVLDVMPLEHLLGTGAPTDRPPYNSRFCGIVGRIPYPLGTPCAKDKLFVCEAMARARSVDEVHDIYASARERGWEGVIVKDPELRGRNGKVAGQWKLKPGCGMPGWEGDGTVIDYVWGDGDKANAGMIVGFRVRLEDGGESNVTGLTQREMAAFTSYVRAAGASNPAVRPFTGRICRVEAMERTLSGSLRHPKFGGFRDMDYAEGVLA